jgi:gas vesicle protein
VERQKPSRGEFFLIGHTNAERRDNMNAKGWAITAGLGAAAGAVAVLMMPRNNPTRRLAAKAANKMEDVAMKMGDTISQKIDSMDM